MKRSRRHGFTLIEVLVVLTVMAIVMAVFTVPLTRWRSRVSAENFVQSFSAQMNLARSLTLSTGTAYRLNLLSATSFEVEKWTTGSSGWVVVGSVYSNSAVTLSLTGARVFQFNDRGLMTAYTSSSGTTATTTTNIVAQLPGGAIRNIIVTALGLTRAV